ADRMRCHDISLCEMPTSALVDQRARVMGRPSARFLPWYYFRLCQHNRPIADSTSQEDWDANHLRGENNRQLHACPSRPKTRNRSRVRHQPEAVAVDFVQPEFFAAIFFSALRFLAVVLSDFSCCSCV